MLLPNCGKTKSGKKDKTNKVCEKELKEIVESALDEADFLADSNPTRLNHEEVFAGLRENKKIQ